MCDESLTFIPTRSSKANAKSVENFNVVTYNSYKKKVVNKSDKPVMKKQVENSDGEGFNIKRAKYEVVKFGMSGFDRQKKEDAKVQLAIRLGAKPPKRIYKNYKEMLEEKRKENETAKASLDFQQLGKNQAGKATAKGKRFDRKRKLELKNDLLHAYGKVKLKSKR